MIIDFKLEFMEELLVTYPTAAAPVDQAKHPKKRKPIVNLSGSRKTSKFADWDVGIKYKLEKFLGEGSYGQVVQAV